MREDCQATCGESIVGQAQADDEENFQVAPVHVPTDGEEPTSVKSICWQYAVKQKQPSCCSVSWKPPSLSHWKKFVIPQKEHPVVAIEDFCDSYFEQSNSNQQLNMCGPAAFFPF